MRRLLFLHLAISIVFSGISAGGLLRRWADFSQIGTSPQDGAVANVYLPVVHRPARQVRRVNIPFFADQVRKAETAILWFGQVNATDNYTDVRIAYSQDQLEVHLAIFDRRLWYDTSPSLADLTAWDSASLYLDLDGNTGLQPDSNAYRFTSQLSGSQPRQNYFAASRGNGSGWTPANVPITSDSGWRGSGLNADDKTARGWRTSIYIPFSSLGLSGPPAEGTIWGLAFTVYDRDDSAGTPIAPKTWPETANADQPATWGQLSFGLPSYTPPAATQGGSVTIRHKLAGATVVDGMVGGSSTCGTGLDFFNEWGNKNYAGAGQVNVQNQWDVADWPCFSKLYITFPLEAVPAGKVILSASLTLHQFGGADPTQAEPSLIQVLTVAENWSEASLTWNNAPLAVENVSQAVAGVITGHVNWPGVPITWDMSRAVAAAYQKDNRLRLVLYESDTAYHSGKYFSSSDTGDWNAAGRPTLTINWGEPANP